MKNDYPPAVVKLKERTDYYAVLAQADKNEYVPLIEFVAETILDSMNIYLKAAKGENIEDDGDLDKEITLFKASFEKTYKLKSEKYVLDVFNDVFLPIDKIAGVKFSSFDDLFLEFENHYKWSFLGRTDEFQDKGETYAIYEEPDETTFLPDLFDLVVERNFGNLDRLSVEYRWFDFVKSKQHIDFYTKLELVYNRTNFQIKYGNKELFESFYGEKIDDNVKLRVANEWVKMAFEELKNKISNEK